MEKIKILVCIVCLLSTTVHADINNGLVGWWRLDEASGNAIDSSGNQNTGTATGTTILSNCKRSGCRSFNGSGDTIITASIVSTVTNNMSFGGWVYWRGGGTPLVLFYNGDSGFNGYGILIGNNVGGAGTKVNILNGGISWDRLGGTGPDLATNIWTHLLVVRDAGTWKLYVNGALTTTGTSVAPNTPSTIMIIASGSFNGYVDDVRFYNRALSAQEAKDLYIPGNVIRGAVLNGVKINQ